MGIMRKVSYVELRESDIKRFMAKCFDVSEDVVDVISYTDTMSDGELGNVVKVRVTTADEIEDINI